MFIGIAVTALFSVLALMIIHECGHYLFGRIAGIGSKNIRLRITHVALRDGDGWAGPLQDRHQYTSAFERHCSSKHGAIGFIAGGPFIQSLAIIVLGAILYPFAQGSPLALAICIAVTLFDLSYLIWDMIAFIITKKPAGDYSSLWMLNRGITSSLLAINLISIGLMWALAA